MEKFNNKRSEEEPKIYASNSYDNYPPDLEISCTLWYTQHDC